MNTIRVSEEGSVLTIGLNRPEARNAFDETMIRELTDVFRSVADSTRTVILTGLGEVFCAGADVNWMRESIHRSESENRRDAARMESMFRAIDECPCPVIGRINGSALGGGMGLLACCDMAVAVESAQFGFTEVRLGIVPAVISPYSLAKIGQAAARRWFLTGELFNASRARELGLVQETVPSEKLDPTTQELANAIAKNSPKAVRAAKQLIRDVTRMDRDDAREHTISTIARIRTSPEGQEGLAAFLEKRRPGWFEPR